MRKQNKETGSGGRSVYAFLCVAVAALLAVAVFASLPNADTGNDENDVLGATGFHDYYDENGALQTGQEAEELWQSDFTPGAGLYTIDDSIQEWYIIMEDITFDAGDYIAISGNVNIIIGSGCTLTIPDGMIVPAGSNLNLYREDDVNVGILVSDDAYAITIVDGGSLVNTAAVTGKGGVYFAGGGSVTNNGSIEGYDSSVPVEDNIGYGIRAPYAYVTVTNNSGGTVRGNTDGIKLTAGGTVENYGSIVGTTGAGVQNVAGILTLNNYEGAEIYGDDNGVYTGGGVSTGNITNYGSIISGTQHGLALNGNAVVENYGSVTGNTNGINLSAGGTVENYGSIVGTTEYGIRSTGGSIIVNNYDDVGGRGEIKGNTNGINLTAGGTVTNNGLITGSLGNGISFGNGGSVTNNGSITGNTNGINLSAGGTVENYGSIVGTTGAGVHNVAGTLTLNNYEGAEIYGGEDGIYTGGGASTGNITNYGSIIGGMQHGLSLNGSADVKNYGSITGVGGCGIYSTGTIDVTVTNKTGGTISGIVGIALNGGEVTNEAGGIISGAGNGMFIAGSTVTNRGSIIGNSESGIYVSVVSTVTNIGNIYGDIDGIWFAAGGTADNSGSVTGFNGSGIRASASAVTINNAADGTIYGGILHGINATDFTISITNDAGGYIRGYEDGICLGGGTVLNQGSVEGMTECGIKSTNASVAVTNEGYIIGGSDSISFSAAGGSVTNVKGAVIKGKFYGIYSEGSASVYNHGTGAVSGGTIIGNTGVKIEAFISTDKFENRGTIIGEAGNGVEIAGTNMTIKNGDSEAGYDGGIIIGTTNGIVLLGGGNVENYGLIEGMTGCGISFSGAGGSVTNVKGGIIKGTSYGIYAAGSASIYNQSSSTAPGGTIIGGTGVKIAAFNGSADKFENRGSIIGESGNGVEIAGTNIFIKNGIDAASYDGSIITGNTNGIEITGGGTVENNRYSIIGMRGYGIYSVSSDAPLFVTNKINGYIQGREDGISANAGGGVTNEGSIRGINQNGIKFTGPADLANYGVVIGNVTLSDDANTILLSVGSVIVGDLTVGNNEGSEFTFEGDEESDNFAIVTGTVDLGNAKVILVLKPPVSFTGQKLVFINAGAVTGTISSVTITVSDHEMKILTTGSQLFAVSSADDDDDDHEGTNETLIAVAAIAVLIGVCALAGFIIFLRRP